MSLDASPPEIKHDPGRPFTEFRDEGLLWLVNTAAFHPRGYALAFHFNLDRTVCTGWSIVGDGTEPWTMGTNEPTPEQREKYGAQSLDELFARMKALMP